MNMGKLSSLKLLLQASKMYTKYMLERRQAGQSLLKSVEKLDLMKRIYKSLNLETLLSLSLLLQVSKIDTKYT